VEPGSQQGRLSRAGRSNHHQWDCISATQALVDKFAQMFRQFGSAVVQVSVVLGEWLKSSVRDSL
jgi:hypothetical protein